MIYKYLHRQKVLSEMFGTLLALQNEKEKKMFGIKLSPTEKSRIQKYHRYYKCNRCGYISVVKDAVCPICTKDGFSIKMK